MRKLTTIILIFFVTIFTLQNSFGQYCTSTWAMTSNNTPAISGNITAGNMSIGSGLSNPNYSSTNGIYVSGWANNTAQDLSEYYEFSIAPPQGYILTVSSISFYYSVSSDSVINASVYYSTNNFNNSTQLGSNILDIRNTASNVQFSHATSISINSEQSLKVRIYAWEVYTKSFRAKNFVFSGITSCEAPSITSISPAAGYGTGTYTLGATASSGTLNWYNTATGSTSIATGTSFTTPSISATTVYYVDATSASCTTPYRTAVTATVNTPISIINGTGNSVTGTCPNFTVNNAWTSNGNNIYNNNSESISIGTSTPGDSAKLSVNGNVAIDNNNLLLRNHHHGIGWYGVDTLNGHSLVKRFTSGTDNIDGPVVYGHSGGALAYNNLYTGKGIVARWTNTGYIGFGTLNPTERVEIVGSLKIVDSHQGNGKILVSDNNGKATWEELSSISSLWSGTTNVYRSTGNVGIGTPTPRQKLEIQHSDSTGGILLSRSATGTSCKSEIKFSKDTVEKWAIGNDYSNNGTQSFFIWEQEHTFAPFVINEHGTLNLNKVPGDTSVCLFVNGSIKINDDTQGNGKFLVSDNNGKGTWKSFNDLNLGKWQATADSNIYFSETGKKVFIGMNSCASCTSATYDLFVKNGIVTQDVKVKTSFWADYVFSDNHKILSINELEKYINVNKHLPGIPSAKEIEKNEGFELGDMQRKLLEKLEEQTLYIIDLQKQLNEMKQQLNQKK